MARKLVVPPMGPPGAAAPGKVGAGKRKGKAAVPRMKGAAPPPPTRPIRGRVALALPVLAAAPARGRLGPPPPAGRMPPPRFGAPPPAGRRVPLAPETPRAERLKGTMPPPPSSRRAQAMAALRRGKVVF